VVATAQAHGDTRKLGAGRLFGGQDFYEDEEVAQGSRNAVNRHNPPLILLSPAASCSEANI
jgi:hypothetical protein